MIFDVLCSSSASTTLGGILWSVRIEVYSAHSSTMTCLTVSIWLHVLHIGWGSLLIRYECVSAGCPILTRVIAVS